MSNSSRNKYDDAFFLTLTNKELIEFCKSPPKDCEYNELKEAADILAVRFQFLLDEQEENE